MVAMAREWGMQGGAHMLGGDGYTPDGRDTVLDVRQVGSTEKSDVLNETPDDSLAEVNNTGRRRGCG